MPVAASTLTLIPITLTGRNWNGIHGAPVRALPAIRYSWLTDFVPGRTDGSVSAGTTPPQLIVESANGIRVRDSHGNELIDAFSSLYCVNAGYGQQRIVDAMTEQAQRMPFFHVFAGATHRPAVDLAETLLRIAGPRMKRVFFGNSGSDANDTQVKLVWYANNVRGMPRKKKIISRKRGYHGGTIVTASLTALP